MLDSVSAGRPRPADRGIRTGESASSQSNDDDCFYYHSRRNNVLIAFGTLWSFLIQLHIVSGFVFALFVLLQVMKN